MQLMRRPSAKILGLVGVVGAVCAGASAVAAAAMPSGHTADHATGRSASGGPTTVSTTGFPSGPGNPGIFTERCRFSHQAADDPILDPGMTGMSMHHDFFGNTATNASSTAASLRGGKTTCSTSADASAYWAPVLYQHGKAVQPKSTLIYWRRKLKDHDAVHTVPAGLQMIAGNEQATAPQGIGKVGWSCVGNGVDPTKRSATPMSCPSGARVKLTVTFPSCWDGHTLSAKTQTNVVYRSNAGCPASHPVRIPQILFHLVYPTSSAAGLTFSMSPDMTASTDTAHVDFINGWNQSVLTRDVSACIATSTRCGGVSGPAATPRGPNRKQLAKLARKRAHRHHHHR